MYVVNAVNPVYNAAEAFLAIYSTLPPAFSSLLTASLTLFVVGIIGKLLWGLRS